jgi:photosystem II stability/assembly factor-like uncharacterized protein
MGEKCLAIPSPQRFPLANLRFGGLGIELTWPSGVFYNEESLGKGVMLWATRGELRKRGNVVGNNRKQGKIGIVVSVLVAAIVIFGGASLLWNGKQADELTAGTETHPHVFGFAPDGETIWMGTHTGMYGFTELSKWTRVVEPLAASDVMGYHVNANDPRTIYVSGHGFVQRSTDGGATWGAIENGMPNAPKPNVPDAHMMTQDPNDPERLYVFLAHQGVNNVYETKNGGETWSLAGTVTPQAFAIATLPGGEPGLLAASNAGVSAYRFKNGETTSEKAWASEPSGDLLTLPNGTVIALFRDGFRSKSEAGDWTAMPLDLRGEQPLGMRVSHRDPNHLAVVTAQYTLIQSTNGGLTWSYSKPAGE